MLTKNKIQNVLLFVLSFLVMTNLPSQASASPVPLLLMPPQGSPFYANVNLSLESVKNMSGGHKTGNAYDGLLSGSFAMNGTAIGLPEGGRFRITALAIASGLPSRNLIGDSQVASNIEAQPNNIRLYDIWYRQDFRSIPLRLHFGIINANDYFNVTDSASTLLNSSFGIAAAVASNAPFSLYPKPGYGAVARYSFGSTKFVAGVFSGNPQNHSLQFDSGTLSIAEWQQSLTQSTAFKVGGWECQCKNEQNSLPKTSTRGIYGSFEHTVVTASKNQYTFFLRAAMSSGKTTVVPHSFALGINYPGIFSSRPDDVFSAGLTQAQFESAPAETSYEVTYKWQLSKNVNVQPDYQFISHPNGNLPDAQVLIFRFNFLQASNF